MRSIARAKGVNLGRSTLSPLPGNRCISEPGPASTCRTPRPHGWSRQIAGLIQVAVLARRRRQWEQLEGTSGQTTSYVFSALRLFFLGIRGEWVPGFKSALVTGTRCLSSGCRSLERTRLATVYVYTIIKSSYEWRNLSYLSLV